MRKDTKFGTGTLGSAGAQRGKDEYDLAMERILSRKPRKLNWIDGRRATRDEFDPARPGDNRDPTARIAAPADHS